MVLYEEPLDNSFSNSVMDHSYYLQDPIVEISTQEECVIGQEENKENEERTNKRNGGKSSEATKKFSIEEVAVEYF